MRRNILVLAAAVAALPVLAASAALSRTEAIEAGAAYIRTTQQADGGYASSPGQSIDAIFALRAAGYDPAKEMKGGTRPADYLKANAAGATTAGSAAKAALAAKALGLDPKAVNGTNLVAAISSAVARAIWRTRSGLRVAPRPMFCGNRVAPRALPCPCTASTP